MDTQLEHSPLKCDVIESKYLPADLLSSDDEGETKSDSKSPADNKTSAFASQDDGTPDGSNKNFETSREEYQSLYDHTLIPSSFNENFQDAQTLAGPVSEFSSVFSTNLFKKIPTENKDNFVGEVPQ